MNDYKPNAADSRLTGTGQYAYKRPKDGILVVPVGCLRD